jgi:hypothetical protein
METYLIQRGLFKDRDYKKGIDSILEFDYMGSSEFENGALFESLSAIRHNFNKYLYMDIICNNKVITVFCRDNQKAEIQEFITQLAENKMRLQEFSGFGDYIYDKDLKDKYDFWWDIENHIMFWKKDEIFQSKFSDQIKPK